MAPSIVDGVAPVWRCRVRLSAVGVTNHTRLADLRIEVRKHLVMVGPNGVGKSALLRCLDMVLGTSPAQLYSQLTAADFRDAMQPLVVEVTMEQFTADDRALFPDEIMVDPSTNRETLTIRLEATVDADENLSARRTTPRRRRLGRAISTWRRLAVPHNGHQGPSTGIRIPRTGRLRHCRWLPAWRGHRTALATGSPNHPMDRFTVDLWNHQTVPGSVRRRGRGDDLPRNR